MAVLWIDNQAGCKGLCDRVPHVDTCSGDDCALHDGDCYDEALLHGLDARLAALPAERRQRGVLLVLHQIGSHGPAYFKRSPPDRKPFMPECTTTVLQQCPLDTVVNAYDNSIAYTDHVLAETLRWLRGHAASYDTALLYVSDHGESLGENNIYLHGLPYAVAPVEQKHVPMLAWFAPDRGSAVSARLECLRQRRDVPLTHDHLFHTVLGVLGIEASEYRKSLDAFAPCRTP